MDYEILSKIDEQLKALSCKSYTLEIKFDNDTKLNIEKKPEDKHPIGFKP